MSLLPTLPTTYSFTENARLFTLKSPHIFHWNFTLYFQLLLDWGHGESRNKVILLLIDVNLFLHTMTSFHRTNFILPPAKFVLNYILNSCSFGICTSLIFLNQSNKKLMNQSLSSKNYPAKYPIHCKTNAYCVTSTLDVNIDVYHQEDFSNYNEKT